MHEVFAHLGKVFSTPIEINYSAISEKEELLLFSIKVVVKRGLDVLLFLAAVLARTHCRA